MFKTITYFSRVAAIFAPVFTWEITPESGLEKEEKHRYSNKAERAI